MEQPNNYEQQIILTCKGYNINSNTIEAIRYIISLQSKLKIKDVSNNMIYTKLLNIIKMYSKVCIENYVYTLFSKNENISIIDIINNLISDIRLMPVECNGVTFLKLKKDQNILKKKIYSPTGIIDTDGNMICDNHIITAEESEPYALNEKKEVFTYKVFFNEDLNIYQAVKIINGKKSKKATDLSLLNNVYVLKIFK